MRRTLLVSLATLLMAGVAFAEDFWIKKEYMQWTDEEVKKLMTNSPWAKDVTISAPVAVIGGRGRGGQRGTGQSAAAVDVEGNSGGGGRGRRGGAGGGGSDDGGGGGTPEALVTVNVSWRSAIPLKKAMVRSRLGVDAAVPPEAAQMISKDESDYVIVVTGVPNGLARFLQNPALIGQTTLRAGKKAPVAAKAMNLQPHTQTVDVIYAFPRTEPIAAEDKEVEIVLKLGQIEAKKKFSLKEMVYNGKLEL